jgi:hypothetical protein
MAGNAFSLGSWLVFMSILFYFIALFLMAVKAESIDVFLQAGPVCAGVGIVTGTAARGEYGFMDMFPGKTGYEFLVTDNAHVHACLDKSRLVV